MEGHVLKISYFRESQRLCEVICPYYGGPLDVLFEKMLLGKHHLELVH